MTSEVSETAGLAGSFRAHQNYLTAFSYLAGFPPETGRGLVVLEGMAATVVAAFPRRGGNRSFHAQELAACLNRAWGTELILDMSLRFASEDELMRIANSWGCVQLYYVGYSATQALIVASGQPRPDSHTKTQEQAVTLWTNRQAGSGIAPFSFAAKPGSMGNKNPQAYAHGPGRDILDVHSWSPCNKHNYWDLAAMALRTTREGVLEDIFSKMRKERLAAKRRVWREKEKAHLAKGKLPREQPDFKKAIVTQGEKRICEQKMRSYGWLDYLYRLRIKANYEETEMFTKGPQDGYTSGIVARNMVRIASATMIAHEVRIAQMLGKQTVLDLARDWVQANTPPAKMGIGLRLQILERVL